MKSQHPEVLPIKNITIYLLWRVYGEAEFLSWVNSFHWNKIMRENTHRITALKAINAKLAGSKPYFSQWSLADIVDWCTICGKYWPEECELLPHLIGSWWINLTVKQIALCQFRVGFWCLVMISACLEKYLFARCVGRSYAMWITMIICGTK